MKETSRCAQAIRSVSTLSHRCGPSHGHRKRLGSWGLYLFVGDAVQVGGERANALAVGARPVVVLIQATRVAALSAAGAGLVAGVTGAGVAAGPRRGGGAPGRADTVDRARGTNRGTGGKKDKGVALSSVLAGRFFLSLGKELYRTNRQCGLPSAVVWLPVGAVR